MREKISAMAKTKTAPDKTIAFIMGNREGLDFEEARKLEALYIKLGYLVHEITDEEFNEYVLHNFEGLARFGRFAVIPHAQSFSVDMADAVQKFINDGGRLLVLGGPLFGAYDSSRKLPSYEGLYPFYKLYTFENCTRFESAENHLTVAVLSPEQGKAFDVVCPVSRSDGYGYDMDRNARIIPLVTCNAAEENVSQYDRKGSQRGLAAYISLADTEGHLVRTNGTRAGSVSCTSLGAAVGVVGIKNQNLLSIDGMEKLLCDMIKALDRGIFLFESGPDKYVFDKDEQVLLGAKILCTTIYHRPASVRFTISRNNKTLFTKDVYTMLASQSFCNVKFCLTSEMCEKIFTEYGVYNIKTQLLLNDRETVDFAVDHYRPEEQCDYHENYVADSAQGEIILNNKHSTLCEKDLVTIENGKFMLDGKEWIMYGYNYWPLYHVSLEHNDYWRGAFDKRNYIQSEVDADLCQIARMGMNCVATRIDGGSFERYASQFRDFVKRCEKYNLKLMLAVTNITTPMYFQADAFLHFLEITGVDKSPALFSYDLSWEVGHQFSTSGYNTQWRKAWISWLCEQFGSIENAEKAIGRPLAKDEAGNVRCPVDWQYSTATGTMAKEYSVFNRFLDNFASRCYNKIIAQIRKLDPCHLFGSRSSPFSDRTPNIVVTGLGKHLDYMGLEGYTQTNDEVGLAAGIALTKASQYLCNNKPVTWIEYGLSLVGVSGLAADTKPKFDMEKLRPFDEALEEQTVYQALYSDVMEKCACKGSLPWFYAGGFRSTEHSDCGHINPDGTLRKAALLYMNRQKPLEDSGVECSSHQKQKVLVDPDKYPNYWTNIIYGKGTYSRMSLMRLELDGKPLPTEREHGEGLVASLEYIHNGKDFEYITEGTDKTSANVKLQAVGNLDVEITPESHYPMKHLDSEFNSVLLSFSVDGSNHTINVKKYSKVQIPRGTTVTITASLGNTGEAKWLSAIDADNDYGCVYLRSKNDSVITPATADNHISRFEDGNFTTTFNVASDETSISLQLQSKGRAYFGERFEFSVIS